MTLSQDINQCHPYGMTQVSRAPNLPWKMIFVLSKGATAVLATAPAKAPEKSELMTDRVSGLRPCTAMEESCLGSSPTK